MFKVKGLGFVPVDGRRPATLEIGLNHDNKYALFNTVLLIFTRKSLISGWISHSLRNGIPRSFWREYVHFSAGKLMQNFKSKLTFTFYFVWYFSFEYFIKHYLNYYYNIHRLYKNYCPIVLKIVMSFSFLYPWVTMTWCNFRFFHFFEIQHHHISYAMDWFYNNKHLFHQFFPPICWV